MAVPIFTALTLEGQHLLLGKPLSFKLVQSMDSPADSFEAVFAWKQIMPKVHSIVCNGAMWYVDEQSAKLSSTGARVRIDARSCGGLLLDNEAQPQAYFNVSLRDILKKHIEPYGFELDVRNNPSMSAFCVGKGLCQWEVLESFCMGAIGKKPRIIEGNKITLDNNGRTKVLIENTGKAGTIPFIAIEDSFKRAGVPSEILVQTDKGYYGLRESNPYAEEYKLRCTRYILPTQEFSQNPQKDARQRIGAANLTTRVIKVTVPDLLDINVGDSAEINSRICKASNLFVYGVTKQLDKQGMTTTLTLAQRIFL